MTSNIDTLNFAHAILVGAFLGAIYFGGLWWTVRKVVKDGLSPLWFVASLLTRTGLIVVGFYIVSNGQLSLLLGCVFGFLISRVLITWRSRIKPSLSTHVRALHAP